RPEAPAQPGASAVPGAEALAPPAGTAPEPVVLEDVVETDPRYIIGITWPDGADRYPGLAVLLKDYADAARAEVMQAVEALGPAATPMYDLPLEVRVIDDTPQAFAVAADGGSYTGGARGTPPIARFVWLPQEDRLLTPADLVADAGAWRDVSSYV